jgi:hypothetical protein
MSYLTLRDAVDIFGPDIPDDPSRVDAPDELDDQNYGDMFIDREDALDVEYPDPEREAMDKEETMARYDHALWMAQWRARNGLA